MKWSLLGAIAVLAMVGCATEQAAQAVLYAPQFRYYEQNEILDTMHRLANGVQDLSALLSAAERDEKTQAQVVKTLTDMETAAGELALHGREASNHPLFDRYLEDLRDRLALARVAAERDPPDYFLVGTITGTCLSCHQKRRATGQAPSALLIEDRSIAWGFEAEQLFARRRNHGRS